MKANKELPKLSIAEEAAPYWKAATEERLLIQCCDDCDEHIFPPRVACPYCLSPDVTWKEASGAATVYTYSTLHHPPHPAWNDDVPYTLGVVRLEEGVYLFTELVNCSDAELESGLAVKVTYDHVTDNVTLPKFEPTE